MSAHAAVVTDCRLGGCVAGGVERSTPTEYAVPHASPLSVAWWSWCEPTLLVPR